MSAGTLKNAKEWDKMQEKYIYYDIKIDSFYISKYELTQQDYENVMGHIEKENYMFEIDDIGNKKKLLKGGNYPIRGSYQEFAKYCNARSKKEGYDGFYQINGDQITINKDGNGYRLLNLFEWMFAAKGGNLNENFRFIGSDTLANVGWYGRNSGNVPHPVGLLKPNSLGLHDMSGNVYEILESSTHNNIHFIAGNDYNHWPGVSDGDFSAYDITYYYGTAKRGTRIALIPKGLKNNNINLKYRTK